MVKRMSQKFQRMTDSKNCKLVLKIFILRLINRKKKNIIVNGDSIIKNVNGRNLYRGDSVKIWPHPGASAEDLIDQIKPAVRKNPDIVVIHTGTNDLQKNCNIVKKAKKLASAVKEVDKDHSVKITFSSIINREDEDFPDKINDVNNKLKN